MGHLRKCFACQAIKPLESFAIDSPECNSCTGVFQGSPSSKALLDRFPAPSSLRSSGISYPIPARYASLPDTVYSQRFADLSPEIAGQQHYYGRRVVDGFSGVTLERSPYEGGPIIVPSEPQSFTYAPQFAPPPFVLHTEALAVAPQPVTTQSFPSHPFRNRAPTVIYRELQRGADSAALSAFAGNPQVQLASTRLEPQPQTTETVLVHNPAGAFSEAPYSFSRAGGAYQRVSPHFTAVQGGFAPVLLERSASPVAQQSVGLRTLPTAHTFLPQLKASYHEDVTGCIGDTPMVKLNRVVAGVLAKKVLVKLEMQNPGGSIKDRIALSMIEQAEKDGLITPGKTSVIEYTSGNTGIGLAMVCAARGYKAIIVMPQVPAMKERYMICRKFGAEVHLTAACKGIKGAEQYVNEQLAANPDYWCPRQFSNPANPKVHLEITGPEIWAQSGGDVDYLVAGAGTGGTVSALGRFLKTKNPNVKIILVEPTESRVLVGKPHSAHTILGIGAGFALPFIEELAPEQEWKEGARGVIDEFLHCSGPEAVVMADQMATKEGLLVGPSAGAAVKVALDVAKRPEAAGKTVVVVCASSAVRYVTHPLWADVRAEGDKALPAPANMDAEPLLRWASDKV